MHLIHLKAIRIQASEGLKLPVAENTFLFIAFSCRVISETHIHLNFTHHSYLNIKQLGVENYRECLFPFPSSYRFVPSNFHCIPLCV